MNVLFINPNLSHLSETSLLHPPLGIGMLSATLKKQNHNVNFIDMPIHNYMPSDLKNLLGRYDPDFIGVTALTETFMQALNVVKECKKYYKTVPIAMGGVHPTFTAYETLERNPEIDYVMLFEGEYAIVQLINAIESKKGLEHVENIGYRKDGEIIINKIAPPIAKLDELEKTDRSIFDMDLYLKRDIETTVIGSRGCPGHCKFCSTSKLGRRYRCFSIERLCDEIEECINMGFSSFFIADDTFACSDRRIHDFYNEVKKRNLVFQWTSNIRIVDVQEERLKMMKEIGAYRVFTGVETISSSSSKIVDKNITAQKTIEAVELLKRHGIQVHTSFIVGLPGDTEETMDATAHFIEELKPTLMTLNNIRIYPGTDVSENPEKFGMILEDKYWYEHDEWTKRSICGTTDLPPKRIDYWLNEIMHRYLTNQFIK